VISRPGEVMETNIQIYIKFY